MPCVHAIAERTLCSGRAPEGHSIKLAVNAYRTEAGLDPLAGGYGCLLGTHRGQRSELQQSIPASLRF